MGIRITDENRKWWVLVAMTGTLSMIMLDVTVVGVALPSIQRDLDLTQTELQWIINAYLLPLTVSLLVMAPIAGRIYDRIGA